MFLFSALPNCLVISINSGEKKGYSLRPIVSRHSLCLRNNTLAAHVGIASYTSGDQKWKGAALTLNKNPILKISKEKFI